MCYPLKLIIKGYFCHANLLCLEVGSYFECIFVSDCHVLKTANKKNFFNDLQRKRLLKGKIISHSLCVLYGILMEGMAFLIYYLLGYTWKISSQNMHPRSALCSERSTHCTTSCIDGNPANKDRLLFIEIHIATVCVKSTHKFPYSQAHTSHSVIHVLVEELNWDTNAGHVTIFIIELWPCRYWIFHLLLMLKIQHDNPVQPPAVKHITLWPLLTKSAAPPSSHQHLSTHNTLHLTLD